VANHVRNKKAKSKTPERVEKDDMIGYKLSELTNFEYIIARLQINSLSPTTERAIMNTSSQPPKTA
jgi:hypothetical protein